MGWRITRCTRPSGGEPRHVTLKLVMIRCPDNVAPEQRELSGGEFSIGRGPDNEWIIADPDRHLSKRHCRFAFRTGSWELSDLSSNGTFLNRASAPLGPGTTHILRDRDRISFGAYELEITIEEDRSFQNRDTPFSGYTARGADSLDPFAAPSAYAAPSGFGNQDDMRLPDSQMALGAGNAHILPADFDPLAPSEESFTGPTQSDHAPAIDSAFRPPPAQIALIPDDWDADVPASPRPASPLTALPRAASPGPAATPQPLAAAATPTGQAEFAAAPTLDAPQPAISSHRAHDGGLAAAFLRGVGMNDATLKDPEQTLEHIGAAVRAAVVGLRQTLMARASIKDEFRIEQTMIRASGNNPLKFSVDDDDALVTLLGIGRHSAITPEDAITEAFRDVRMHELATISAMQAAVRVLLAQFDPAAIERKAGTNALNILPGQRKARAWDAFTQMHQSVTQALSDNFDSVFGKAFARAYEQAIDELTARGTPP